MNPIDRREFVKLGAAGTAAIGTTSALGETGEDSDSGTRPILMYGDGLGLTPVEYASLLHRLADGGSFATDSYSIGGVVETLERKMAALLGKERAVFLPTGTLANLLAVSALAESRNKRRVVTQVESHLYNDAGDGCQALAGLHLIGLEPGRATLTLEHIEREAERAASGRVDVGLGAISIESPVRRLWGRTMDFQELGRISEWAHEHDVGLHLDGARLLLSEPYTGVAPVRWAELCDTVYVSLWKYLNAASGAILAGPAELLDDLYHQRRLHGGSLPQAWPHAAVALHFVEGFERRFQETVELSEQVLQSLEAHPAFTLERVTDGSNVAGLQIHGVAPDTFRERAKALGVHFARPGSDGRFKVQVNETWLSLSVAELVRRLEQATG